MTDITIIGAGPAGATAAVYAVRAGLTVNLLESDMVGGQVVTTPEIDNFPPFTTVSGFDFANSLMENLDRFGIEVQYAKTLGIEETDGGFKVVTEMGDFISKAVIIANGAKRRKLGCKGEERLSGMGVSWCAVCDGGFFKGKVTAVNGGGNSALEDAIYLTGLCSKVYLIHRRDAFRAPDSMIEELKSKDNVEILTPFNVEEIKGDQKVSSLLLKNAQTGEEKEIEVDALFEAIGLVPDNAIFSNVVKIDEGGYIITDDECKTSHKGIFAAGDTRNTALRQITTAVSDGAVAATKAYEFIKGL